MDLYTLLGSSLVPFFSSLPLLSGFLSVRGSTTPDRRSSSLPNSSRDPFRREVELIGAKSTYEARWGRSTMGIIRFNFQYDLTFNLISRFPKRISFPMRIWYQVDARIIPRIRLYLLTLKLYIKWSEWTISDFSWEFYFCVFITVCISKTRMMFDEVYRQKQTLCCLSCSFMFIFARETNICRDFYQISTVLSACDI